MRRASAFFRRSLALLGVGVVVASGCYKSGEGPDPDDHSPYYPVGIALSPSGKFLFLANSNFDLRFNSGTLQAFDAQAIADAAVACRKRLVDWRGQAEKAAAQGKTIDTAPACRDGTEPGNLATNFARADVRIGAFAADLNVVPRRTGPDAAPVTNGARLLLPVRGDASLTVVDFDEDGSNITLRCAPGAGPNHFGDKCAPAWRLTGGEGSGNGSRGLTLEGEPFALATMDGFPQQFAATVTGITTVVHQSTGDVSLFVDSERVGTDRNDTGSPQAKLAYTLLGLPGGATAIAPFSLPGDTQNPRFLVTNRSQSTVSIVQFFPDPTPDRSGLVLTGSVALTPQSQGFDSRGILVDPPNPGETRPTRVFVTNRTPAAIVLGQVDSRGVLTFFDNVAMPVGPSRITRAVIDGKTLILAASFDARALVVYDPDSRRVSNVMLTHRGPYALAIDSIRKFAYIANFTDSTIQVLDLDPLATESIIYSVGAPSGPRN
ncbi:MAG: YncE family protein [Polyangiales bacterium]